MPSGFTTARTMRKKTPVFRTTSSMAFSQLLGLQERVEKIGEGGDGQNESKDGFKGHGVSLSLQISSQRFTYQSDSARRPSVRRRKRASSMSFLSEVPLNLEDRVEKVHPTAYAEKLRKVDVELHAPLPLSVESLVIKPDGSAEQADVLRKVVVEAGSPAAEDVLARRIVSGKDEPRDLVPVLVLGGNTAPVKGDHEARVLGLARTRDHARVIAPVRADGEAPDPGDGLADDHVENVEVCSGRPARLRAHAENPDL